MTKFLKFIARAVLIATMAAGTISAKAAGPLETENLVMGFGVDLPFAPHIVGIKKGWFKEAGFESVETKSFSAGALAGQALIAGQIHLWTPANVPPIAMFHNGIPVVILGTDALMTGLEKLVVRKNSGIEDAADLEGKTVALLLGSSSGAWLGNLKKTYGLKNLKAVNLAPPEALASLKSGDVDGMIVWEPWVQKALTEADTKVVHTGEVSFFKSNHGSPVKLSSNRALFVASQDFVRANPRTVSAIMKVLVRSQKFVADPANRDEVLRLFSEFQKQDLKTNAALFIPTNYRFDPTIDELFVKDMEATADFLESDGRIKGRKNVLEYTYTDPLKAIDPSLVKVQGKWKP